MNSKHLLDLTFRLSQALDQNYDVVNMDTVISVISTLEGSTITKEQLETTRLAKYINQLRRRTKSESLARRAKSLLKRWREMVGIQQQTNESTSSVVSPAAIDNTIVQSNLQQQQRLLPDHAVTVNSKTPNQYTDVGRLPLPTNVVSTSLTKSANSNVHINNKRLEIGQSGATSALSPVVPINIEKEQQPTTFTNLIPGFYSEHCNATIEHTIEPVVSLNTSERKFSKTVQRVPTQSMETFIIDQSSNSEGHTMSTKNKLTNIAPIIIDIQDSNSSSALTPPTVTSNQKTSEEPHQDISAPMSFKPKKVKKEKKRKERENQCELTNPYSMVVLDEASFDQLATHNIKDEKFTPVNEDKSCPAYPMSNISEILSLSNSSISSLFPSEGASRVMYEKPKLDMAANSRSAKNLSLSDLTFTGKFKQQSNPQQLSSSLTSELIDCNSGDSKYFLTIENTVKSKENAPQQTFTQQQTFVPFSDVGSNSNESTTSSRASHFDLIDVASQDNNQQSSMRDLRLQKKQDASNTKVTQQKKESLSQHKPATKILTETLNVAIPEQKVPKKRGRKKGSKGVDSVIAKETSLSSQMLISSLAGGGKKVKTTRELYAEMQSRKISLSSTSSPNSALTNWPSQAKQIPSRPESSCSEPSLHSPRTLDACSTNATMSTIATRSTPDKYVTNAPADFIDSDSGTITSEPSRDSTGLQKNVQSRISLDSNSNSLSAVRTKHGINNQLPGAAVEQQLIELLKQLPSIPTISYIEQECSKEILPCTCKVIEVMPQLNTNQLTENDHNAAAQANSYDSILTANQSQCNYTLVHATSEEISNKQINCLIPSTELLPITAMPAVSSALSQPMLPPKPKKSIFDLDFDDDDDPLNTLLAEAAAVKTPEQDIVPLASPTVTPNLKSETSKNEHQHVSLLQLHQLPQTQNYNFIENPPTIFTSYKKIEDPECVAKQRFEIQTQKITKFHIDALHNCFIPNVNGNWDNADTQSVTSKNFNNLPYSIDGHNVVCKYGSFIKEHIQKDLGHIVCDKNFKPKKPTLEMERLNKIPFVGMARQILAHRKVKERKHRKCHKTEKKQVIINESSDSNGNLVENLKHILSNEQTNDDKKVYNSNIVICKGNSPLFESSTETKLLKDISIEVTDQNLLNLHIMANEKKARENVSSQSLLAIVDRINFQRTLRSEETDTTNKNFSDEVTQKNKGENEIREKISAVAFDESRSKSTKFKSDQCSSDIADDSINTENFSRRRRSSSCSNSSLKQTQHSINMKLRQQRQSQEKEEQRKRKRTNKHQRSHPNSKNLLSEDKKPPRIKRIKIAINGDVATQRQISVPSSSNSTDDEQQDNYIEKSAGKAFECNDGDDFSIGSTDNVNDAVQDDDIGDLKNEVADVNDNNDYDDADFEEEFGEGYNGDYHEVVTRDILVPSTGSNHIVLTIKKTPSKTNSPSNSLSAMSPVITTTSSNAPFVNNNPVILVTTHNLTKSPYLQNDAREFHLDEENMGEAGVDLTKSRMHKNHDSDYLKVSSESINTPLSNIENVVFENKSSSVNFLKKQRLQRRRSRKLPMTSIFLVKPQRDSMKDYNKRKQHRQLFFPHELYVSANDGSKQNILNISSSSSSCTEDSDYECLSASQINVSSDTKGNYIDQKSTPLEQICEENTEFCPILRSPSLSSLDCLTCSSANDSDCSNVGLGVRGLKSSSTDHATDDNKILKTTNSADTTQETFKLRPSSNSFGDATNTDDIDELPRENNRLLLSFNNICYLAKLEKINRVEKPDKLRVDSYIHDVNGKAETQHQKHPQQLPNKNCDHYNNLYNNNNNFNIIKYVSNDEPCLDNNISSTNSCKQSSSNSNREDNQDIFGSCKHFATKTTIPENTKATEAHVLMPHKEYRTGQRAVDEDVHDEDGNNCARIQQFKEWYQVLQLRSYNDELLTVLPYVVLE